MQGFDEFLQSSPALMMKYNAVTDKYAKKMAQGGAVTPTPAPAPVQNTSTVTDDMIKSFFNQNKNNPAALKQAAMQYNIKPEYAAKVLGMPVESIQNILR
jgi:hypothetical protein